MLTQAELTNQLCHACSEGKLPEVKKLIRQGADFNGNNKLLTPLICAIYAGHAHIVDFLSELGVNINYRMEKGLQKGITAIEAAYRKQNWPIFHQLIARGAEVYPLGGVLEELIKKMVIEKDKKYEEAIEELQGFGVKIEDAWLVEALNEGKLSLACELILRGAKPNTTDKWGDTALHLAAIRKEEDAVITLVAYGVNPKQRNHARQTPADLAEQQQDTGLAKYLRRLEKEATATPASATKQKRFGR